jgi:dienelactone hydrolase
VLCYGFTLDLDGATGVAEAAARFRFANPCAGRSLDDLPPGLPLFVARAGRDEFPGINAALDRFVAEALARNLPLELRNLPDAAHAFDILDASHASQQAVRRILAFLQAQLRARALPPLGDFEREAPHR